MIYVNGRRCLDASCTSISSFNFEGIKTAAYCKKHAVDGMVNVNPNSRCSHLSCTNRPMWGLLTAAAATACSRHKNEVLGIPVINFKAMCKEPGCGKVSRWGLNGQQPTHCRDHGPLQDELVCTIGMACSKGRRHSKSDRAVWGSSTQVKTGCVLNY